MTSRRLILVGVAFLAASVPGSASAQAGAACFVRGGMGGLAERPSPLDSASVRLGGAEAKVCYGAPSARGREVMGDLVPHGQPWRTGANEATALHLAFSAEVGGVALEPGSYSLYTIPGEASWEVVINRSVERWGIPINDGVRSSDVASFTVTPGATSEMVERLVYRFDGAGESETQLVLEWERTRITIPIRRTGA